MGILGNNKEKEAEAKAKETSTDAKPEETSNEAPEIKTVEKDKNAPSTMDSKKVIEKAASEKRKIRRSDRMDLIVIKKTKHYKIGQRIQPSVVYGEDLVERKIAKEYEEGDEKKHREED